MSMLRGLPDEQAKAKGPAVGVATVDVSTTTGPPRHLASGILYGIPDRSDQIPDHFYKDIGFNYGRGGGSQLPNTKGYAVNFEDYKVSSVLNAIIPYTELRTGTLCISFEQL